ncbi:hypothetical protein G3R49_19670 [Shewanella sp. WXL01]|uniref:hypothetical protein n=1 Tax=Shewanella sp. WXL01 TaxID=2709721 RepID=UPI0014385EC8|nr:hypothetical protein [Shewanella sp. WXL01]NKF52779.1 hypothetical protein [Shewanella sp. WXL01]
MSIKAGAYYPVGHIDNYTPNFEGQVISSQTKSTIEAHIITAKSMLNYARYWRLAGNKLKHDECMTIAADNRKRAAELLRGAA